MEPQDRVIHEGWLNKESQWIKVWRPRYFRLWESGALDWHLDDSPLAVDSDAELPVRGTVAVKDYVIRAHPTRPKKAPTPFVLSFEPIVRKKMGKDVGYLLACPSMGALAEWGSRLSPFSGRQGLCSDFAELLASAGLSTPEPATGAEEEPASEERLEELESERTKLMETLEAMQAQLESSNKLVEDISRQNKAPAPPARGSVRGRKGETPEQTLRAVRSSIGASFAKRPEFLALQKQLKDKEITASAYNDRVIKAEEELTTAQDMIAGLRERIAEEEAARRAGDEERAKLQDERTLLQEELMDAKGRIRVFGRTRGGQGAGGEALAQMAYSDVGEQWIEIEADRKGQAGGTTKQRFALDRVFPPEASQEAVFKEVSQLITSCLDGHNVVVVATGQTGSGKTHTMEGPELNKLEGNALRGLIPRACEQIFAAITDDRRLKEGWSFAISATAVEIYMDKLRDLQGTQGVLKIRHSANGVTTVDNVISRSINSAADVYQLLKTTHKSRVSAATAKNERSSRSHSVFTLEVVATNALSNRTRTSRLVLVDLAGSERVKKSEAKGDRLKEAQAINKSLSALTNVLMQLRGQAQHISYRDSKLTYLLQNSLSGTSKVLLVLAISALADDVPESVSTLRLGTKVREVEVKAAAKARKPAAPRRQ